MTHTEHKAETVHSTQTNGSFIPPAELLIASWQKPEDSGAQAMCARTPLPKLPSDSAQERIAEALVY